MEKSPCKILTKSEALKKAARYCAIQERCHSEMRSKLFEWRVFEADAEAIIAELISQGFINEERFSVAFAGGKFRIKKWGKNKIKGELKKRNLSEYCINKGLKEINSSEYDRVMTEILKKKSKEITEKNQYRKMNRIAAFAIQRGFESELVWDKIKELFL